MHHVIHGGLIAAAEAIAIVALDTRRNMGMTVFVAIVDVGSAMVVVVLSGSVDTVVISLTLNFAKLLRRRVPVAVVIAVIDPGRLAPVQRMVEPWQSRT